MGKYDVKDELEGANNYRQWAYAVGDIILTAGGWDLILKEGREYTRGPYKTRWVRPEIDRSQYDQGLSEDIIRELMSKDFEEQKRWDSKEQELRGIIRRNVSQYIRPSIEEMNGVEAWDWLKYEYGATLEEEGHLEWRALCQMEYEYSSAINLAEFLEEFHSRVNNMAALGKLVADKELRDTLRSAFPPSWNQWFSLTLVKLQSGYHPGGYTYASLRQELARQARSETIHENKEPEKKSGLAVRTLDSRSKFAPSKSSKGPEKSSRGKEPESEDEDDKPVYASNGKLITCDKCQGNHYASWHRGQPRDGGRSSSSRTSRSDSKRDYSPHRRDYSPHRSSHRNRSPPPRSRNRSPYRDYRDYKSSKSSSSKSYEKRRAHRAKKESDSDSGSGFTSGLESSSEEEEEKGKGKSKRKSYVTKMFRVKARGTKRWTLDTGTDTHVAQKESDLFDAKPCNIGLEGIVEGAEITATKIGRVLITPADAAPLDLKDVLYGANVSENLISLQKMVDAGCTIVLDKRGGTIVLEKGHVQVDPKAEQIEIQRPDGKFWTLESSTSEPSGKKTVSVLSGAEKRERRRAIWTTSPRSKRNSSYWHIAMGHLHDQALGRTKAMVKGMKMDMGEAPKSCSSCAETKAKGKPFPRGQRRQTRHRLEIVHMDLIGKSRTKGINGERYALVLVDQHTRRPWTILLKRKSDTFSALKSWTRRIERHTGRKVRQFHSDGGGEFISKPLKEWEKDFGIGHRYSHPHRSAENSIVERMIHTLKSKSKAIRRKSGLPPSFWGRALLYANWTHERSATSTHASKTSYEAFEKEKPDVSMARRFGETGWVYIAKEDRVPSRNEQDVSAVEGQFIGISDKFKGWEMLLKKGGVVSSRDVDFWDDEDEKVEKVENEEDSEDEEESGAEEEGKETVVEGTQEVSSSSSTPGGSSSTSPTSSPATSPPATSPTTTPAPTATPPKVEAPNTPVASTSSYRPHEPPEPARETPPHIKATSTTAPPLLRRSKRLQPRSPSPSPPTPPPAPVVEKKKRQPRPLPPPRPKSERPRRPPTRYDTPTAASNAKTRTARILIAKKKGSAIPRGWKQAMASESAPKWGKAATKELENLAEKKAVVAVPRPEGAKILRSVWVADLKKDALGDPVIDEDGGIGGQKMRLVADGSGQVEGVDYVKLASATAQSTSIHLVLGYAAEEMHQEKLRGVVSKVEFRVADFKGAYLNAKAKSDKPIYIEIPPSNDPELEEKRRAGWVWLVLKALYGLCQSAAWWGEMRDNLFRKLGFKLLKTDGGVYIKRKGKDWLIVPSHVDDLLGVMNAIRLWNNMISELEKVVTFSKIDKLSYHLGASYFYDSVSIMVNLAGFIDNIARKQGLEDCRPARTPMVVGSYVKAEGTPLTSITVREYQHLLGQLSWPERIARPDITLPVRSCQRFAHDPTEEQLKVLKRVVRYLVGTKTWGIRFIHDGKGFHIDTDATYAADEETRKSRGGWNVQYNGPVAWGSELQFDHALSSAEAEFYGMGKGVQVGLGIGNTAAEIGIRGEEDPILVEQDNTATISIVDNPYTSKAIRHVDLRHHWLRDLAHRKRIVLQHLSTDEMPSDIFTKSLSVEEFEKKRGLLGMVDVAEVMGLRSS
ncbi:hypothetical protein P7C70_g4953, partial [Phenoliferia sp. Uapishka_3]